MFLSREKNYLAPSYLNLIFVSLNEAKEKLEDCTTKEDLCAYYLRHMKEFTEKPADVDDEIGKIFDAAYVAAFSAEKMTKYIENQMTEWEYNYYIEFARKESREAGHEEGRAEGRAEGKAEGKAEGIAEGLAKGKAEVIAKMTEKGMSLDAIAEILDMTTMEVKASLSA